MRLRERENALFDVWKDHRVGFLRDGAGSAFEDAPTKIIFLLKEAVGDIELPEAHWDLRDFINDGARWMTWNNIARWSACILDHAVWEDIAHLNQASRMNIIRRIAGVNLKKIPGEAVADMHTIRRYALEDRQFLQQQISLYQADLIICCGTFWIAEEVFSLPPQKRMRCGDRHFHPRSTNLGTVLEFLHPQAWGAAHNRFDEFRTCIDHLKNQGQIT